MLAVRIAAGVALAGLGACLAVTAWTVAEWLAIEHAHRRGLR